jgi:excisionase family DNA binding protein
MDNQEEMTISIGDAAKELGVSVKTVRRWADAGKIRYERSPSGHRRFYISDVKRLSPRKPEDLDSRITINYARVSSHEQKDDLASECVGTESSVRQLRRQIKVLESFSASNGWEFETISDLGSGLNYNKKGLKKLLKRIMKGDIGRLVLTHCTERLPSNRYDDSNDFRDLCEIDPETVDFGFPKSGKNTYHWIESVLNKIVQ